MVYANKNRCIKDYIIIFMCTFIFQIVMLCMGHPGIEISRDSIGMLNLTSRLAGNDWRPILGFCQYYGWGIQWLYSLPLIISDNPYIILLSINLINYTIIAFIAILIYFIQIKHLNLPRNFTSAIIAISLALLTELDIGKTLGLEMGIWLSTYLLFSTFGTEKNIQTPKRKILLSILCPAIICYTKNFHETAIVIYFVMMIVLFYDYFIKKNKSVYLSLFIFSFCFVYLISNIIKADVITWLTTYRKNLDELVNTSVGKQITLWPIESFKSIKLFFYLIFSNFLTLDLKTFGLYVAGIVIVIYCLITKKFKLYIKEISMISLSFMAATIGIAGVAEIWGAGLNLEPPAVIAGRAYCYVHYYFPFCLPGMLGVVSFIRNHFDLIRKIKIKIIIFSILRDICFIKLVYPVLANESLTIIWQNTYLLEISKVNYLMNIIISTLVVFMALCLLVSFKHDFKWFVLVLIPFSIYIYSNNMDNNILNNMRNAISKYGDASYNLVSEIDPNNDWKNQVYAYGDDRSYGYQYSLQFLLNRYQLQPNADSYEDAKLIFVSSTKYIDSLSDELIWLQINDYEYVATFSKDTALKIEELGGILVR